jgi:hypothetical protein
MIPLYAFNDILYYNFCDPLRINTAQYTPSYNTKIENISWDIGSWDDYAAGPCYFLFEEPLNLKDLDDLSQEVILGQFLNNTSTDNYSNRYVQILANSEKSSIKQKWCKENKVQDWYFFFHGFACLFWYHHYKFYPQIDTSKFTHVFITYNHLLSNNRSYRLTLLSHLLNDNLDKFGLISAPLLKDSKVVKNEIYSSTSLLSIENKLLIKHTLTQNDYNFILDTPTPRGDLSAKINSNLNSQAFFQLVTETVFYGDSLHLTEKIFKPIVCRQPFILVSTPGNLAYFKSYGFKTFDKWIDESYDTELDNDKRITMIIKEIKKLCRLSMDQLRLMHKDMQDVLNYNYNHFYYGNFKKIITKELVDNFFNCAKKYNFDRSERFRIPIESVNADEIFNRLMQP